MVNIFTGRLGPREIALAVAFGVLIGVIPKGNLLVIVLGLLLFLSHANLVLAVSVVLLVSLLSPWIHPLCHRIGADLLTTTVGQNWIGRLFQIPIVPWTMLDNTVVLGAFCLGLALFLPIFLLVWGLVKLAWPKDVPTVHVDDPPAGPTDRCDANRTRGQ